MLFAAGFGTRMGALTKDRPKPLIQVAGRALIDHTLDLVAAISPRCIVANAHYHHAQLDTHLHGTNVTVTTELPDILDTGGGLRAALPMLGTAPVFTANTDAIWHGPNPFTQALQAWDPDHMDALLVCVPLKNAVGHAGKGDFVLDDSGRARRGPGLIYGGIQIIKTTDLSGFPDTAFSLNLLWDHLLARGRLYGLPYEGKWCDVGTPYGIKLAETLLESPDV